MLGKFEPGKSISAVKHAFLKSQNGNLFAFGFTSSRKRSIKRLLIGLPVVAPSLKFGSVSISVFFLSVDIAIIAQYFPILQLHHR